MRSDTRLRSLVVWLGLAAAPGCGGGGGDSGPVPAERAPGKLGDVLCRLMLEQCDCARVQEIFSSLDMCSDGYAAQLEMYFAEAQAAGLEYHPECMGEYLDFYSQTIACSTRTELSSEVIFQLEAPPCKVHSGAAAAGEACTNDYQALGDSCVQGLQCVGGMCMEFKVPTPKVEGEACDPQTDLCELGTLCTLRESDPTGPTTCVRGPAKGEPCGGFCDVGLYCDTPDGGSERVCLPPPGEGEACAPQPYQCAEGLRCDGFTCNVGLPEGTECQGDDSCAPGLECGEAEDGPDVCQPEQPLVCF